VKVCGGAVDGADDATDEGEPGRGVDGADTGGGDPPQPPSSTTASAARIPARLLATAAG
jgi:hypothetical protein